MARPPACLLYTSTLQNYKCLASTTISGDGIYAEYTYHGDKQELYEDVYGKLTDTCICLLYTSDVYKRQL